ncbi:MAG: ribosome assembly cofactor RimP [Cytophagaceae bacterium]|nr:ribosome assembly cofactor RimP [Cytophagaceae bacterium]
MREKVEQLIGQVLDENPSLFLISLDIKGNNEITVVIDGDEGVTVSDCVAVSRGIEHNLDREEEDFSLEVMSAGATAPLINQRQYNKNLGRNLEVRTKDGEKLEGDLVEINAGDIKLAWKTREPKPVGKGKHTVEKEAVIPYENIEEAKVKIKF